MRKFLATLACLLPLTMAACGGPTTPDNEGGGGGAGSGTSFSALIEASSPVGAAGTYLLNGDPVAECAGTATCTVTVEAAGHYTLDLDYPNHLFVPKDVEVTTDGDVVNVSWASTEWGLAPDGWYVDNDATTPWEVELKTWTEDGKIFLKGFGHTAVVTGNTYSSEWDGGSIEGTISDDLTEVAYRLVDDVTGRIFDGIWLRE